MFGKTRVVYHFHDMAMHHSRLATFYSGASPGAALCAQPSALRGEGSSFNLTIRLILMDRLQGTTRVSLLQFPNQTLSPGRRLNLQHREGSICNTPNDLILAQFATQRWLNLQHTKIYKQPFRFNWVGTGLICAHRSDSSVHTTGSWRLICTHTHTQVKNERHT